MSKKEEKVSITTGKKIKPNKPYKSSNMTFKKFIIIVGGVILGLMAIGFIISLTEEPVEEQTETISVEEAIENGTYELTDQDMNFRRDIDDILREIDLPEMNAFSFTRISDWKSGKRYYFEIKDNGENASLVAYTENGIIVSIKSTEFGYVYDISN